MVISDSPAIVESEQSREKQCIDIRDDLIQKGLFQSADDSHLPLNPDNNLWRISSTPYLLSKTEHHFLKKLGNQLLSFYQTCNRLYLESLKGQAPEWIANYLNQGKPESVLEYARMNRFKRELPGVIRPDLIPTDTGMIATELDAVPGGIGLTAALSAAYSPHLNRGRDLVGESDGMLRGFSKMIRSMSNKTEPLLVIVVSEESESYRTEMTWLAKKLTQNGLLSVVVSPKSVLFTEDGLWIEDHGQTKRIDLLYRFFELFDLKNIPKAELMLYAAKKKRVVLTPPPKAQLEEKSLFALFHHPSLKSYWRRHLGEETNDALESVFPKTWIIDPSIVPPHAVIPDLTIEGQPVTDFRQMGSATKKERQFVIKPSGFSEWAWGSRGVSVGHDLSEADWRKAIDRACTSFPSTPHILQKFHKGKKVTLEYYNFEKKQLVQMEGRARLSPYYFVEGKEAHLCGVLATVCSLEKKLIHGMVDAIMAPCAVSENAT